MYLNIYLIATYIQGLHQEAYFTYSLDFLRKCSEIIVIIPGKASIQFYRTQYKLLETKILFLILLYFTKETFL